MRKIRLILPLLAVLAWLPVLTAEPIDPVPPPTSPSLLTKVFVGAQWFDGANQSDVTQLLGVTDVSIGPMGWAQDANAGLGSAMAHVGYGTAALYSDVSRTGESSRSDLSGYMFRAYSYARFTDGMLIDSTGLTGTPGTITLDILVSGSMSASGSGATIAGLWVRKLGEADFALSEDLSGMPPSHQYTTAPISFTYGVPFQFYVALQAAPSLLGIAEGAAQIDMWHTATLNGLNVFDGDGAPVTGYTLTTESGAPYPASDIPEPASVALAGLGLAALVAAAWRKRRSA